MRFEGRDRSLALKILKAIYRNDAERDQTYEETVVVHGKVVRWYHAPTGRNGYTMIKSVGGTEIAPRHRLSCHCGAVVLELELPDGIVRPRRCDCSMCRRRGAIVASVPLSGIRIVQGAESLRLYQFNTHTAKHYFCCHCGIYTHHQRRSNPEEFGYNVGCLEGVNPYQLGPVPTMDGVNHPSDRGK